MHWVRWSSLLRLMVVGGFVLLAGALALGTTPASAHDALPIPDVSAFGDAVSFGSTSAVNLVAPVVGMAATPDGGG
jgi:hypothetical protein